MRVSVVAVLIPLAVLLSACSASPRYTTITGAAGSSGSAASSSGTVPSSTPSIPKPPPGTKIRGLASYYANEFHGRKTSNGETFDMYGLTAAHKTLPFNTWLEVKNLANSRTVIVRVNDRGPFVEGRVLDLSYGAAKELDMIGAGVQQVEITVLK